MALAISQRDCKKVWAGFVASIKGGKHFRGKMRLERGLIGP
jgi:hypothetical protein